MNGPDVTTYKEEEEAKGVKFTEIHSAMQAAAIALASEQNCAGIDMIHFSVQPMRTYGTEVQAAMQGGPAAIRGCFSTEVKCMRPVQPCGFALQTPRCWRHAAWPWSALCLLMLICPG